jgi:hypothetical protein
VGVGPTAPGAAAPRRRGLAAAAPDPLPRLCKHARAAPAAALPRCGDAAEIVGAALSAAAARPRAPAHRHRPTPAGHVEGFLAANATRRWRGRLARDRRVAPTVVHATVLAVRNFLDDITAWGWAERPTRQLIFAADVPRLPRPLPRALPATQDTALMTAVAALADPFARTGLTVLRGAGLRLGELLDLELGGVVDYGPAAEQRGWASEVDRHTHLIQRLQEHLGRIQTR